MRNGKEWRIWAGPFSIWDRSSRAFSDCRLSGTKHDRTDDGDIADICASHAPIKDKRAEAFCEHECCGAQLDDLNLFSGDK